MERARALSQELLDELELYRRVLNNIPAEVALFDLEGRFQFSTPSGIRDASVREWVLGKTHHEFFRERGYPMSIAEVRQSVIERCIEEKRRITFEEVWEDVSGRRRYYVRAFSPVLDEEGQAAHVIGYGHQITELRRGEEKRREGRRSEPREDSLGTGGKVLPDSEMRRRERDNLLAALKRTDWQIYGAAGAAHMLGLKPTTLASRIKKLGLERRG